MKLGLGLSPIRLAMLARALLATLRADSTTPTADSVVITADKG